MVDHFHRLEERMDEQRFEESDRLRCLVAEARKALEKVGVELSMISRDGLKLPPHGKLKRKRDFSSSAPCMVTARIGKPNTASLSPLLIFAAGFFQSPPLGAAQAALAFTADLLQDRINLRA
jgi:hypothetical protein